MDKKKKSLSLIDRVSEDVNSGHLWLARRRLTSRLASNGYDPELLKLLADICHRMGDAFAAGAYGLTSSAENEEVEKSVAVFLEYAGNTATQRVSQLPPATRLDAIEAYPQPAQERLRRHGLAEAILREKLSKPDARRPLRTWLGVLLFSTIGMAFIAIFIEGLRSCMGQLWGRP